MNFLDWNHYSVGTRILGAAIGAILILGFVFGGRVLTELGVPEKNHLKIFGVSLLLPALWLLARMRVEDEDRADGEK